jgi:hypothetical protein
MIMKKTKLTIFLLALPALFFVSCNKENDMDDEQEYLLPVSAGRTEIVEVPNGLLELAEAQDLNAITAISYMQLVNTLSGLSSSFIIPPDAKLQSKKSNSRVYQWSMQGYSYWMTYTALPDKNTWKYEYQFPEVPRFTYIYAEESKSGKEGFWNINSPNDPALKIWNFQWSTNALSSFQASVKLNDTGTSNDGHFEAVTHIDKSGSFVYTIGNQVQAEVLWTANGSSGTYKVWNGVENQVGFWN